MHIVTIININKALNSFFYFIQTNLLKNKTNLGQVKLFVRVFYWGGLLDAVLALFAPLYMSPTSTTGIGLSANNFLTGSGIFPSPEGIVSHIMLNTAFPFILLAHYI